MEYKRVDRIMKQVEQHHRGDFSINGDWQFSRQLAKQYREESQKKFNGDNGLFGPNRMSCTEGCTREGELLVIPSGQVVYGPYFAFAKGTYYAWFNLSGDFSSCTVQISSQTCGTLASGEVAEVMQDERIMLPFSLLEDVTDLELKVINHGQELVYFKNVLVTDTPDIQNKKEADKVEFLPDAADIAASEKVEFPEKFGETAGLIDEAVSLQKVITATTREVEREADCTLPKHGRFQKVKRLIRKVINCYVHFQLEFNRKIIGGFWTVVQELQLIIEIVKQQFLAIGSLESRMAALAKEVVRQTEMLNAQNAAYSQWKAEVDTQNAACLQWKAEVDALQTQQVQQMQHLSESIEKNDRQVSDALMRLEQLAQMIEQMKNTADQKPVRDEETRAEIGHLWAKIKEIDQEFRGVWQNNREVNANLNSIWHAYNTFRQEVFYEMDHRSRSAGKSGVVPGDKHEVRTVIHSTAGDKIAQSGGKVRLNLGSGTLEVDGYLSVDARQLPGVDVVAEVSALPYEAGSVDEIYSAHLIEHFTAMVMEKELLPYWHSLLKDGGVFRVVFPDLDAMIEAYKRGEIQFKSLAKIIMGGQDYQLDYHYAVYSPEIVVEMLGNAGFRNIEIVARGRENGGCRETEIVALK